MAGYLGFGKGLKFPWGKPGRLWNILWVLIPILGAFALMGYIVKIVKSIIRGNTKELPEFGKFWVNFKAGIMLFLRLLPLIIILIFISIIPLIGQIAAILAQLLLLPYLVLNVMMKESLASSFEIQNAWSAVTKDFGAYVLVVLKTIGFSVIYGIASIILIGIPCLAFGNQVYLADWFSKRWKK